MIFLLFCLLPLTVFSSCPYLQSSSNQPNLPNFKFVNRRSLSTTHQIDYFSVKFDIQSLLTDSQDYWPADYGNYGPFFIRQAWHCAGSYRTYDGQGGCDGGRQRFDPERSWADNTNLDKAKKILWPIKKKYGPGLSWGDLIILAGTTAIESMGGPILGVCLGRIDDEDGSQSLYLGPTPEQERLFPCPTNGDCPSPLGDSTLGLIYVNPEGPMGNPDPAGSAPQVRDTFARMGMNDSETVALIGGGHAFGKTHGSCPLGPGPAPNQQPSNPWPGMCGTGKGADTFTSGFEGPWTPSPTQWGNYYFQALQETDWEVYIGPGGHNQWRRRSDNSTIMLTTDLSLIYDPDYKALSALFASDLPTLESAFSHAWYKLTTRDMGPVTRCSGPFTPPAQPFQYPLPSPPPVSSLPNWSLSIKSAMWPDPSLLPDLPPPDYVNSRPYFGAQFVQLAYQCASSFRQTDFLGGCNGARIRFSPGLDWPQNAGLDGPLQVLLGVKDQYGPSLSWSDLIVFAGQVAIEEASGLSLPFCPGRTDSTDGAGWDLLQPPLNYSAGSEVTRYRWSISGLTLQEMTVLSARLRSSVLMASQGFEGSYTSDPSSLSNFYFSTLLNQSWTASTLLSGQVQYSASPDQSMTFSDLNIAFQDDLLPYSQNFASDNDLFLSEFASAWTKLVSLDRFDGPAKNLCPTYAESLVQQSSSSTASPTKVSSEGVALIVLGSVVGLGVLLSLSYCLMKPRPSHGGYSQRETDGNKPLLS